MHFPLGPRSAKALRIGEEGGKGGLTNTLFNNNTYLYL